MHPIKTAEKVVNEAKEKYRGVFEIQKLCAKGVFEIQKLCAKEPYIFIVFSLTPPVTREPFVVI